VLFPDGFVAHRFGEVGHAATFFVGAAGGLGLIVADFAGVMHAKQARVLCGGVVGVHDHPDEEHQHQGMGDMAKALKVGSRLSVARPVVGVCLT